MGGGLKVYSLTRVCVDSSGALENWACGTVRAVEGASPADLTAILSEMLMDINLYKPVAFSSLKAGMVFERVD